MSTSSASAALAVCELDDASESVPWGLLSTSPRWHPALLLHWPLSSLSFWPVPHRGCHAGGAVVAELRPLQLHNLQRWSSHQYPKPEPPSFEGFWSNQGRKQHRNVQAPGFGYWEFYSDLGNFQTPHLRAPLCSVLSGHSRKKTARLSARSAIWRGLPVGCCSQGIQKHHQVLGKSTPKNALKCTRLPHPRRQSFAMPSCNVESARFCAAVLKTATTTSPGDNPQPAIHTNNVTSELTSSQERYQSFKDAQLQRHTTTTNDLTL